MQTLIVKTENEAAAKLLMAFLKTVRLVKSVTFSSDYSETPVNTVNEPAESYNWTNPDRPATDEEFEQMIAEAEKEIELGLGIPAETARKQTLAEIKKWKKK